MIAALQKRFPAIRGPYKEDICYATTNRQEAVKSIAGRIELLLVVGAPNSSNSRRLVEVGESNGTPRSMLVQRASELDWATLQGLSTIGITAGASAPELLVNEIIDAFRAHYDVTVETVTLREENVSFKLPRELREVQPSRMTANKVIVHTDGACSGNPGPGGWGVILDYNGTRKELSGGEAETTNNRMELMAAITALEALKRPCTVEMHVDSTYVKDGITKWIHGWKKNGWKTADKKPVKNAELWQRLDAALEHARDLLALGEGPRRPRRQRTRRRTGARGHGAVQAAVSGNSQCPSSPAKAGIPLRRCEAGPRLRWGDV